MQDSISLQWDIIFSKRIITIWSHIFVLHLQYESSSISGFNEASLLRRYCREHWRWPRIEARLSDSKDWWLSRPLTICSRQISRRVFASLRPSIYNSICYWYAKNISDHRHLQFWGDGNSKFQFLYVIIIVSLLASLNSWLWPELIKLIKHIGYNIFKLIMIWNIEFCSIFKIKISALWIV